jgi:hypothetical protein
VGQTEGREEIGRRSQYDERKARRLRETERRGRGKRDTPSMPRRCVVLLAWNCRKGEASRERRWENGKQGERARRKGSGRSAPDNTDLASEKGGSTHVGTHLDETLLLLRRRLGCGEERLVSAFISATCSGEKEVGDD